MAACGAAPWATVTSVTPQRLPTMATINRKNLQDRRVAAVQAWSAFVERGDDAETLIRPEILRSWELSRQAITPDVTQAPLADEGDTAETWRDSPLAAGGRRRRGGAAAHRRGRRPRHRGHRRGHPDPVDLRRPGDAPQGRVGELRGRRALGRGERRHQRPRDRDATGHPVDGVQRRALRLDRAQLGVLGGPGPRPVDRPADRASSTSPPPGTAPTRSAWRRRG